MENGTKKFHFIEIDWLIYFPSCGNHGKYNSYTVLFRDRRQKSSPISRAELLLGDILERKELEDHYPHTVGFFKAPLEDNENFKPRYMEIRTIHYVDEFWLFLNALNI